MDATATAVAVLDLASLRLHRTGRRVDVLAGTGELLASIRVAAGEPTRLACFRAFDAALGARVSRAVDDGTGAWQLQPVPVALYNPATGQVAIEIDGRTRVHGDGRPVALAPAGEVAHLAADGALELGGRQLADLDLAARSLSRELAAHRAPVAA